MITRNGGTTSTGENGHNGFPIEKLEYNSNKDIVGSVSHDNFVRLLDARILKDDDDDCDHEEESADDDEMKLTAVVESTAPVVSLKALRNGSGNEKYNSDDEWGDMDSVENYDSEDCSSDESEPSTVNARRKKRLKTENEKFFDDL